MAPVLAGAVLQFDIWINMVDCNAGQCNFRPSLNSWQSMGVNDNSHSKQRCLRLHSSTNTQGIKRTRKKQNKFGFPICTDPLAHQHLNENMNLQSKGIYGRESSWSVRGKMAAIARDKHCKSNGGKGRKLAKNMAFHKIISSFPAVSPHLIWHTFLQQCI